MYKTIEELVTRVDERNNDGTISFKKSAKEQDETSYE